MPEITEDSTSERPDLHRIVGIVRRRRLQFLVPLFCGWLLVWSASWILPARYRSGTLILVEEPSMPDTYVVPNISNDMQSRLESMTQQILSRTRLLVIMDKFHLYETSNGKLTPEERVDRMRKDIDVELVRDPQKQSITAFRVYYVAKDAHIAQAVTGELTTLFISENLKTRQREAEGTTSFIQQQLDDARSSLSEQEATVKQFQGQHFGELPTQQASNLQILAGLQAQLQNEQDGLNTAQQQHAYLQAMIEQERQAQGRIQPANGANAGPTDVVAIDQQLEKMRAQLAELSSRYTDRYPDVLSLKSQIAKTEAARERAVAAMKRNAANPGQATVLVADPALSAAMRQLQGQLQSNQLEISNRQKSIIELKGRIGDYQARLNSAPATEQQLADLTRGYDQSKANYDDLLKKRDQSQMATSMEQMQQGQRFTMLDPPSLPLKPDFPNRLKFCVMGMGVGIALGVIVAGGFEFLDDRMHTDNEIKSLLPITVLSEVPEILTPVDEERARRKVRFEWATTAAVLGIMLAGALFSYLHG